MGTKMLEDSTNSQSPLLLLPRELRDEIYEHVLEPRVEVLLLDEDKWLPQSIPGCYFYRRLSDNSTSDVEPGNELLSERARLNRLSRDYVCVSQLKHYDNLMATSRGFCYETKQTRARLDKRLRASIPDATNELRASHVIEGCTHSRVVLDCDATFAHTFFTVIPDSFCATVRELTFGSHPVTSDDMANKDAWQDVQPDFQAIGKHPPSVFIDLLGKKCPALREVNIYVPSTKVKAKQYYWKPARDFRSLLRQGRLDAVRLLFDSSAGACEWGIEKFKKDDYSDEIDYVPNTGMVGAAGGSLGAYGWSQARHVVEMRRNR